MLKFNFKETNPLPFPLGSERTLDIIKEILVILREEGIRAVAGGGALRDLSLTRPVKDIDIFIPAQDVSDDRLLKILTDRLYVARVMVSNEATEYLAFTDVASVIEATDTLNQPIPIQFIRVSENNDSPEQMIGRLDLGLCQIGMDVEGDFWCSPEFQMDVASKTMTVTRSKATDVERSTKRFERLVLKYPGWTLVVPDVSAEA